MITEQGRLLAIRPRVHQLRVPNLSEVNFDRLRAGRLARLQTMMQRHDLPVCLFYSPANIRYATGTDVQGVYMAGTFARYCMVPAAGDPILFEFTGAMHVSRRFVRDVRPARAWEFFIGVDPWAQEVTRGWAKEIRSVMRELGAENERLGVDKLDTTGFLALQEEGIRIANAGPATVDAREVKTPEEVALFKINGGIGDAILAEFEAAIRPGIREYELLAVLSHALLSRHGEFLFTRLSVSGTNTNPWFAEAHDKVVMPGDLVAVDTDANGYEGYVIDVSRTFLCGDNPSPEQKEAYRIAYDCVNGMFDLIRPGMTFEEFWQRAPKLPEAYRAQRYCVMAHQAGLEDEGPAILYPEDYPPSLMPMPTREIKENMVLCLECYAGKVGAPFGVKLEDQVLVTKDGAQLLCTYPYDAKLLS
ncbi:MAG: aminopeptidase P family protein [Chloroflexi bacterium]|nr:aminopeptidase P family protein [Chloroflexota bacterium]